MNQWVHRQKGPRQKGFQTKGSKTQTKGPQTKRPKNRQKGQKPKLIFLNCFFFNEKIVFIQCNKTDVELDLFEDVSIFVVWLGRFAPFAK